MIFLQLNFLAETAILKAHELDAVHFDYLYALFDFYHKRNRFEEVRSMAEKIIHNYPDQAVGKDLLKLVDRKVSR